MLSREERAGRLSARLEFIAEGFAALLWVALAGGSSYLAFLGASTGGWGWAALAAPTVLVAVSLWAWLGDTHVPYDW